MTLPNQPSSVGDVLGNEEFYRLFQAVGSPGDIFEIDSSTRAIYVGPNSDLAEYRVTYYDPQSTSPVKQVVADVSVNGPFVGRLDSLLGKVQYPNIGQKARLLINPVDIVDPAYVRPTLSTAIPKRRFNVPPKMDVICAIKNLPDIPAVRADRTLRYPRVPFQNAAAPGVDNGSTDLVIPIYGRRMVTTAIITPIGVGHTTSFYLVALQPGQTPFAKFLGQTAHSAFATTSTTTVVFRASDQVDHTSVTWAGTTADPAMPSYDGQITNWPPLDRSKGMGDLLVINIAPNFTVAPPGYSLVDLFIKISDREQ